MTQPKPSQLDGGGFQLCAELWAGTEAQALLLCCLSVLKSQGDCMALAVSPPSSFTKSSLPRLTVLACAGIPWASKQRKEGMSVCLGEGVEVGWVL